MGTKVVTITRCDVSGCKEIVEVEGGYVPTPATPSNWAILKLANSIEPLEAIELTLCPRHNREVRQLANQKQVRGKDKKPRRARRQAHQTASKYKGEGTGSVHPGVVFNGLDDSIKIPDELTITPAKAAEIRKAQGRYCGKCKDESKCLKTHTEALDCSDQRLAANSESKNP